MLNFEMEKLAVRFLSLNTKVLIAFTVSLFILLAGGTYVALFVVPPDYLQSDAQRIMYIHVPSAWANLTAMLIVGVCSILYLITRRVVWDDIAWGFAQVGAVFAFLNLATGSIWAKPIWGVWWTWDARLTTTAILFMIYIAYLVIAKTSPNRTDTAKTRAIIGIFGLADLPLINLSVVLWRTLHQQYSVLRPEGPSIHPEMLRLLLFNSFVVMALMIVLGIALSKKNSLALKGLTKL